MNTPPQGNYIGGVPTETDRGEADGLSNARSGAWRADRRRGGVMRPLAVRLAVGGMLAAATAHAQSKPVSGGALTWGVTTEPVCFDPHRSSQQNAFFVIRNYVDSLIAKQANGTYAPWLATSWTISPDGRNYTFSLRKGVTFSDGTPFDAAAVKANLDWVKDPQNAATAASFLVYYDHTDVVDPSTIRIVLRQADSTLLESLSSVKLGFLSPKILTGKADLCSGGPGLIGTGPFVFESYRRGQSVTFARNPNYAWPAANARHKGPAYLDRVTFRFIPEYAVRAGALESGQVDVIEGIQPTDIALFKGVPGFQFLTGPSSETSFTLNVNYTRPPADDFRVRQALRDGFDLNAIVQSIYDGTMPRAWSIIGPSNASYAKSLVGSWGNRIAEANKLLDAAGWTGRDADGFRTRNGQRLKIELGYPQPYVRDNRDILIQAIQAALRQNIGLDLDVRIISANEFAHQTATATWSIYPNTDNPSDAAMELWDMLGSGGFLYENIKHPDPDITALIDKARLIPDPTQRQPVLDTIQQRAVQQGFIIPLFAPHYQVAAKATVHGLDFEPQLDGPASGYDVWVGGE
jgi:peptide/nickel transport system substrate-binding protein